MEIGTAPNLVQCLCELSTAVDQALTTPRLGVDPGLALAELAELLIIRNKFDALAAVVTQATIDSGAIAASVHRTPGNWVGAETNQSPRSTNADQRLAKWLKRFPEFETAHAQGILSREHLRLLRYADNDVTRRVLFEQQDYFVNTAQTCGFAGFEIAVQYWIDAADPDGQIPREQERSNEVSMYRRSDGSLSFKGQLDPILGTIVFNALNTEHDKIDNNTDNAHDDANELSRSRCSRRGQALANLVAKGALRADGTVGAPLINVVMSQQVEDLLAGATATTDPFDIDKRCEFIDGTPLHPAFAKKLLMDRTVFRRIVMSARSIRLDVSVDARLFPRWMKDVALVTTRGRCSEPGCDAPSHWIEADHIHPHSRNGPPA